MTSAEGSLIVAISPADCGKTKRTLPARAFLSRVVASVRRWACAAMSSLVSVVGNCRAVSSALACDQRFVCQHPKTCRGVDGHGHADGDAFTVQVGAVVGIAFDGVAESVAVIEVARTPCSRSSLMTYQALMRQLSLTAWVIAAWSLLSRAA